MKKIINNLSKDVEIYVKILLDNNESYSISNYGFIINNNIEKTNIISDKTITRKSHKVIADLKENEESLILTMTVAKATQNEENIVFYEEPFLKAVFNKKYRELSQEILNEEIYNDIKRYENENIPILNSVVFDKFCHLILSGEERYEDLIKFCKNVTSKNIYKFYLRNYQKSISLFIDNKCANIDIAASLSSGYEIDYIPTKKIINLYNKYTEERTEMPDISLRMLCKLVEKYSFSEMEKLMMVAKKLKISSKSFWDKIYIIEGLSLTEISNYIIRNVVTGNFLYSSNIANNVYKFLELFIDYLNIKTEEDENFPDDIKMAHDMAIVRENERAQRRDEELRRRLIEEQQKEMEELENNFKNAVSCYQDLKWEKEIFSVEIPKETADLDAESDAMHNCVRGYKKRLANKQCQICFLRKENKPYITIEINMDGEIVQAKKFANALPDDDDLKILNEWSTVKGLVVKRL